jgi:hypothetical protein
MSVLPQSNDSSVQKNPSVKKKDPSQQEMKLRSCVLLCPLDLIGRWIIIKTEGKIHRQWYVPQLYGDDFMKYVENEKGVGLMWRNGLGTCHILLLPIVPGSDCEKKLISIFQLTACPILTTITGPIICQSLFKRIIQERKDSEKISSFKKLEHIPETSLEGISHFEIPAPTTQSEDPNAKLINLLLQ